MLNKEEIKQVLKIKGEVRGVVFNTDVKYVLEKKGEEGLAAVKNEIKKIDKSINYDVDIKAIGWYPLSWRVIFLLVARDVFSWQDEDIIAMGETAPKHSFVVKTLLRYFISLEKTFSETSKYWEKHYSIGRIWAPKIDIDNKHLILRLENFKIHKILCVYFIGYFKTIAKLVIKTNKMTIRETKCMFNNAPYHEYVIDWE